MAFMPALPDPPPVPLVPEVSMGSGDESPVSSPQAAASEAAHNEPNSQARERERGNLILKLLETRRNCRCRTSVMPAGCASIPKFVATERFPPSM
jgi:hypothetical protein